MSADEVGERELRQMYDQPPGSGRRRWYGQIEPRPHIRPPRSTAEQTLLVFALLGFVALAGLTAFWYPQLPATIPTHFGANGQPDAYGAKLTILLLPAVLLFLTVLFAVISRYPWSFNYPVAITAANAERQYQRARLLLVSLNAVIAVVLFLLQWQIIQLSRGGSFNPSTIVLVSLLIPVVALGTIIVWAVRSR